MITFNKENVKFTFRVAGIAIENGMVLLHRNALEDFWAMPGGRGELLENSKETLKREMKEEIDVDIKVIRVIYFVENFFQFENFTHHEVSIYYLMQVPEKFSFSSKNNSFKGKEGKLDLIFKWFKLDQLKDIRLYPTFLQYKLRDIKSYPEHIIHIDN
ncbi:MAG: NUDIX hydrolase [Candidatus Hermodarchaeota archaeon]